MVKIIHKQMLSLHLGSIDCLGCKEKEKMRMIDPIDYVYTNIVYRGSKEAFKFDHHAATFVRDLVSSGEDKKMKFYERGFLYLPLEHSEAAEDQELR